MSVSLETLAIIKKHISKLLTPYDIDSTLSILDDAADSKFTGDRLTAMEANTRYLKKVLRLYLLEPMRQIAYLTPSKLPYYEALAQAVGATVLLSITASFDKGTNKIYATTDLQSLKQYLTVTENYSDGTTTTLQSDDYTISGTLTEGASVITVSYGVKTTTFEVVVDAPVLDSITASFDQGNNTVYTSSDLQSLKQYLTVTENYSDGTTSVLDSSDYTLSGTLTSGTSVITVSYNGKSTTFNVIVDSVTVSSITAVFTQGANKVYPTTELNSLKQYLVITVNYSDSTSSIAPAGDYLLDGTLTVGTSTITVYYGGKSTTFSVTVDAVVLDSIVAVFNQGANKIYPSTTLDTLKQYLTVTGNYSDNSSSSISSANYTLSGTLAEGTSTITVSYNGKTTTFTVVVDAIVIVSITADFNAGSNTIYTSDELNSLKQYLSVTAQYSDNTVRSINSSDYTLSGTLAEGTSTITVSYSGKTTTFDVVVETAEVVLSSITASFDNGGRRVYSTDGLIAAKEYLTVTANYSDNTTTTLGRKDYAISGTLINGASVITVSYGGKSTTVNADIIPITPEEIEEIVGNGDAREYFNIGDIIHMKWTNTSPDIPVVYDAPAAVVHFGDIYDAHDTLHEDAMYLQWIYDTPNSAATQFDNGEAIPTTDTVYEAGYYYYRKAANSTTTYSRVNFTAGDTIPTDTSYTYYKHSVDNPEIFGYGSNDWSQSAERQWLNSTAGKGKWWAAQHEFDTAPTSLSGINGFMRGFENDWLSVFKPVKVQTVSSTFFYDGSTKVTYDKFFTPSLEQAYAVPEYPGVEGEYWEYWKDVTGLSAPSNGSSSEPSEARRTYALDDIGGTYNAFRLRSSASSSRRVYIFHRNGYRDVNSGTAFYKSRPAFVIYSLGTDSITATFNQGSHEVDPADSVDTLKECLTVTAHYNDGTSRVLQSSEYVLSGSLDSDPRTITVLYDGKQATFTVVVMNSINAVFDKGSYEVHAVDNINSLKRYLTVTVGYTDGSTRVLQSSEYTLSGTLEVGTCIMTVSYGSISTTFSVVVDANPTGLLYNWDFTKSLEDERQLTTAMLGTGEAFEIPGKSEGTTIPVRDSTGVVLSDAQQFIRLISNDVETTQILLNKTIQIDFAEFTPGGSEDNMRVITLARVRVGSNADGYKYHELGLSWINKYGQPEWALLVPDQQITAGVLGTRYAVFCEGSPSDLNGTTLSVFINRIGIWSLYFNNTLKGYVEETLVNSVQTATYGLQIGAGGRPQYGGCLYSGRVTGVRIYEGTAGLPRPSYDITRGYIKRTCKTVYDDQLETIGSYAFYNCTQLESVELPAVTSIGEYAFSGCTSLTSVELPSVTSIGNSAFRSCTKLTSIELPAATSIGDDAFNGCSQLTSIELPEATSVGSYIFYSCSSLTSVKLPNATRTYTYAFANCSSLTSVELPVSTRIYTRAFQGCTQLIDIYIPAVSVIENYAFYNCSNLTSIELPSVTSIATYAFRSCTKLTSVIIRNTSGVATLASTTAFNGATNAIIYVPDALVSDYKSATNWGSLSDKIKGLSELVT